MLAKRRMIADLQGLSPHAARQAVGHGHAGRLPEGLAVPEAVPIISPVLFLSLLDHLDSCQLWVRCAVLGAVGDQPHLHKGQHSTSGMHSQAARSTMHAPSLHHD